MSQGMVPRHILALAHSQQLAISMRVLEIAQCVDRMDVAMVIESWTAC